MLKLTQLVVDRIKPDPGRRLEIADSRVKALYLVVQPSGTRSWAVRGRIGGKQAKLTLGSAAELSLADARRAAQARLAGAAEAPRPMDAAPRDLPSFGEVAEAYLTTKAGETRRKTQIERERHLRRDWAPFHDRPLADIRRADILAELTRIKDGHGPVAANRSRSSLHALYAWAIDGDYGLEANPVAAVRRPTRREPSRERVLRLDELRTILAEAGEGDHGAIVRLLMMTGQRRDEVGGMRWSELEDGRWVLPPERTKNGRAHLVVPLSRQMLELLEARPRGREHVFGEGRGGYSGWSRSKARLDRRCQLAPWALHDLRRSFVTHLTELGIAPPHVIEAIVNHVSGVKGGVAGVYNRAEHLAARAKALQAWADHLTSAGKVVSMQAAG